MGPHLFSKYLDPYLKADKCSNTSTILYIMYREIAVRDKYNGIYRNNVKSSTGTSDGVKLLVEPRQGGICFCQDIANL